MLNILIFNLEIYIKFFKISQYNQWGSIYEHL